MKVAVKLAFDKENIFPYAESIGGVMIFDPQGSTINNQNHAKIDFKEQISGVTIFDLRGNIFYKVKT